MDSATVQHTVTRRQVRVGGLNLVWHGGAYIGRVFSWSMGHHDVITVLYISVNLWIFWRVFDNMTTVLYGRGGRVSMYGRILLKAHALLPFCIDT